MVESLQKLTELAGGLSVLSKVLLSAVLILATVLALSILWSSPSERGKSNLSSGSGNGHSADIRVTGKGISIGDIVIQQGDSHQVKQKKISLARRSIASEIKSDISAIDARLGYVEEVISPDKFEEKLRETRKAVAPSAAEAAAAGYRRLIAGVNVSALRQAFNSRGLRADVGQTLVQMLVEAGVEVKPILYFHDQLREVESAAESLLSALEESTKDQRGTESIWSAFYTQRITLAVHSYRLRSDIAYLAGLKALRELKEDQSDISAELASLKHLEIQDLSDPEAIERAFRKNLAGMEEVVAKKKALNETGQQRLQKEVKEYERINEQLQITKTDTWSEVVGKAISLRELGRVPEAIAAFHQYEQMFSPIDPGAKFYGETAKAFTQQMKSLKLDGGIYVYQVLAGGAAQEANLKTGDIIIEYEGKPVAKMDAILNALNDSREGEANRITYLRLQPEAGRFTRHISVVKGGPLGAGIMPI